MFDYDEDNDVLKSLNETSNQNSTKDDYDQQPQRAKRDITFGDIGQKLGNFVKGLVRRIRDTGHTLSHDKRMARTRMILTGNHLNFPITFM